LSDQTDRFWSEIYNHTYEFDRIQKEIKMIETLSKQNLVEFFLEYLYKPTSRAKISIQIFGKDKLIPVSSDNTLLLMKTEQDISNFKKALSLYPNFN